MTTRIETSVENLGIAATEADVGAYCEWADAWFEREYPELDVEHVPGGAGTPRDSEEVFDAEQECFEAWCSAGVAGSL